MSWMKELPPALAKALKAETHGELVVWAAQPNPLQSFLSATAVWLFAIPWTAFSLFMFAMMAAGPWSGAPVPESLGSWGMIGVYIGMIFMVPFLVIGFGMMAAPWYAYFKARKTVYAITDRRLLVLTEGRQRKLEAIEPQAIKGFTRTERRDGSGTLKVTLGFGKDSDGDTVEKHETIWYVPGVRRAEQLLQALRQKAKV